MKRNINRIVIVFLCLLFGGTVITGLVLKHKRDELRQTEAKYIDDPVMLYQTVGIRECGYDSRHKGECSGAVRLKGNDLARAIFSLEDKFGKEITDVLYINAPEADEQHRGQPALLPLKKQDTGYCALGVAGSYSTPLFLEFQKKYQSKIQ